VPDEACAIEAKAGKDGVPLRLERDGQGVWRIPSQGNIRADKGKTGELLRAITGLRGELRSGQEALFSDYGITDDEAFSIAVFDKDMNVKEGLLVGTKRPGQAGCFLRKAGSANVFLADKDLLAFFGIFGEAKDVTPSVNSWIDLFLVDIDPAAIESIKIIKRENDAETVKLAINRENDKEKGTDKWAAPGTEPAPDIDAAKVKNFIIGLKDMKAMKAVEAQTGDYGFDKPYLTVELGTVSGASEFLVGNEEPKETGDRYVKDPEGHIFFARRYAVNKFDTDIANLLVETPPPATPPAEEKK